MEGNSPLVLGRGLQGSTEVRLWKGEEVAVKFTNLK